MNNKRLIYTLVNEQTVLLAIIGKLLGINHYRLFLLYETFGNDIFLFFDMLKNFSVFSCLTQYRIRRYQKQAYDIARAVQIKNLDVLTITEKRTYKWLSNMIIENRFKFEDSSEEPVK